MTAPTESQLNYLNSLGYSLTRPRTAAEASMLIDMMKAGYTQLDCQAQLIRVQQGSPAQVVQPQQIIHQTVVSAPAQSQALPAFVNFMCFPGLGQLIQGRVLAALVWWALHILAALSCFVGIGFILWPIVWIACVIDAARYSPSANQEESTGLAITVGIGVLGALVCIPIFFCGGLALIGSFAPDVPPSRNSPVVARAPSVPPAAPTFPTETPIVPEPTPEIPVQPSQAELEAKSAKLAVEEAAKRVEEERLAAITKAELEKSLPPRKTRDDLIDEAKWRVWTANTGNFTVDAKFIRFGAGKVTLEKRDGKVITVDVGILVDDDAAFIREQRWLKAGE